MKKLTKSKLLSVIFGNFYNLNKLLSFGKLWNFILGPRSCGKSTAIALFFLIEFIFDGKKFCYIRRTEKELDETKAKFFNNAIPILQKMGLVINDFKIQNNYYYIKLNDLDEWQECGICIPLSQSEKFKSNNLSDFRNLVYDEFISMDINGYLGARGSTIEFEKIISLYITIDRDIGEAYSNKTKIFFLGNNASYYNPIFLSLGIDKYIDLQAKFVSPKGKPWIVQQVHTSEIPALADNNNSVAYQLLNDNKALQDYNFNNTPFDNQGKFIEKINKPMLPMVNVCYNNNVYTIYYISTMDLIYVDNKGPSIHTLALTTADQRINYSLVLKANKDPHLKQLQDYYYRGRVRFSNMSIYLAIGQFLCLTPRS